MEIVRRQQEEFLEVVFSGRLDGYSAEHLANSVGEAMQEGKHAIRVNLAAASYISSAGIGILVKLYQQFAAVNGSFAVIEPSASVKKVLELVGVADILAGGKMPTASVAAAVAEPAFERREIDGGAMEIHRLRDSAELVCGIVGSPKGLAAAAFTADDCRALPITENRLALGLGAFAEDFDQGRDRFGEFLAVAGAAAGQPTDATNAADYMTASGSFVPRVETLYGMFCDGAFSKLARFESSGAPLALSAVVDSCLAAAGAETAGFVMVAESAGLMGAALKRSPVSGGASSRLFGFPDIRGWLSFSPERSHTRALALIVGVASVSPPDVLRPLLRPLAKRTKTAGHFHAAAFGYRPLQKGKLDLRSTVRSVFDAGGLQGVLHLLADDREIGGGGESELLRGACWIGPIRQAAAYGENA
jgi:anti-anti-sigma factor